MDGPSVGLRTVLRLPDAKAREEAETRATAWCRDDGSQRDVGEMLVVGEAVRRGGDKAGFVGV
jgi:hypothetical protein